MVFACLAVLLQKPSGFCSGLTFDSCFKRGLSGQTSGAGAHGESRCLLAHGLGPVAEGASAPTFFGFWLSFKVKWFG